MGSDHDVIAQSLVVKHIQPLFPHFSQYSPFCHPSQTQLDSSRHASASAAVGPEKVMPLWPLWSTRNESERRRAETERRATQSYEHVGIVGFFYERVYMK